MAPHCGVGLREKEVLRVIFGCLVALVVGCSSQATPAKTPSPPTQVPDNIASPPANPGNGQPNAAGAGTATIMVGDRTYKMSGGLCTMSNGLQMSMATADGSANVSAFSVLPQEFALLDFARNEAWQMPDNPPDWTIAPPEAAWAGTLVEQDTGQELQASIDVNCQ